MNRRTITMLVVLQVAVLATGCIDGAAPHELSLPPAKQSVSPYVEWSPELAERIDFGPLPVHVRADKTVSLSEKTEMALHLDPEVRHTDRDESRNFDVFTVADSSSLIEIHDQHNTLQYRPRGDLSSRDITNSIEELDTDRAIRAATNATERLTLWRLEGLGDAIVRPDTIHEFNDHNRSVREIITGINVRYERLIDGYPTLGTGVKLYVALNPQYELQSLTMSWPIFEQTDQSVSWTFDDSTRQRVEGGEARWQVGPECGRVEVSGVSIEYFMPSKESRTAAFPVLALNGTCLSPDGEVISDVQVLGHLAPQS